MQAPFELSPSVLARFFFHDCDRFLRFRASQSSAERKVIPMSSKDTRAVTEAVLGSGLAWEEEVLERYLCDRVVVAPGEGRVADRSWSIEESVEQLRVAKPGQFLYQLTLRAPGSIYSAFGLGKAQVKIRDCRPDLVEIVTDGAGERAFRIIDIKRGKSVRFPYRIQVLFYALVLEHTLSEHGIEGTVDTATGAAWLGEAERPELFDLAGVRPHLVGLLQRLPSLFEKPMGDADWHIGFRCEWCEYLGHCRSEMVATNNVSRLVGLTAHGKRFLAEKLGVDSLSCLEEALDVPGVDGRLQECASLAGERPRLVARLRAYEHSTVVPFGALHPGLPKGENIAIFLTAQVEPSEGQLWLVGMLLQAEQGLHDALFPGTKRGKPFVAIAKQKLDSKMIRGRFIRRLHEILLRVNLFNESRSSWSDKASIQLYCYSDLERQSIVDLLMGALQEDELREQAGALLLHIQAPDLLQVESHPEVVLPHPMISLVSAVGRLLALPVDVAYSLPETLSALGASFQIERDDRFQFPLGHGVLGDDVLQAWSGEAVDLKPVTREGGRRLLGYQEVLKGLRKHAAAQLVAWLPKHKLMLATGLTHPRLSQLAFLTKYEGVVSCSTVRARRCESREIMAAKGRLVPLIFIGNGQFRVDGLGVMLSASEFTRWLVVSDTEVGMLAQARFNDWARRNRFWGGRPCAEVGVGVLTSVREDGMGFAEFIQVAWDLQHDPPLSEGDRLLLMPRFTDVNSEKTIAGLERLDIKRGLFTRLLDATDTASDLLLLEPNLAKELRLSLPQLKLTPSQARARDTIYSRRVSVVWGPPGTGKTYFLAALGLALCQAHRGIRRPYRVLVTAMTHAAIENVLRKMVQLGMGLPCSEIRVAKVGSWQSEAGELVEVIAKKKLDAWMSGEEVSIVGSTVWGLSSSSDLFDLIVIDEASQVRVADAALAIERLSENGRLVCAGDHHQLGPILAGTYPSLPAGEPTLHGSILDLLRGSENRAGVPVCQLLENWRMCDVLTRAAQTLYGEGYVCATSEVSGRRLSLANARAGFIGACLDPDSPMVVVVLDGIQSVGANHVEAGLVCQITSALRDEMIGIESDEEFWQDRLAIVSPHHVQIHAICSALAKERDWEARPAVGTVDKMQGQEADAVLISYGVSDPEVAAMEEEFIYSRNRLNVAFTRARAKCVLFLSRQLLEATPAVLESSDAVEGLAFMQGLVQHASTCGSRSVFELGGGVVAHVCGRGSS